MPKHLEQFRYIPKPWGNHFDLKAFVQLFEQLADKPYPNQQKSRKIHKQII